MDFCTESEAIVDRGRFEVSSLESSGTLPTGKSQSVACMSRRCRRGIPGLEEALGQWIGGALQSPLSEFYTNRCAPEWTLVGKKGTRRIRK